MPHGKDRRTKTSTLTVPQCAEAIHEWFHKLKPADPVRALDFGFDKWPSGGSPTERHLSGVEKDFRTDIPLERGSQYRGKGGPVHRTNV